MGDLIRFRSKRAARRRAPKCPFEAALALLRAERREAARYAGEVAQPRPGGVVTFRLHSESFEKDRD